MSEKLKFKIGLSGTYWDKRPNYTVSISGKEYAAGTISGESDAVEFIEFTADLGDGGTHSLEISLLNKEDSDIKKDDYTDPDNYKIIGDMLLNVESIEIDDIDLGMLRYSKGVYKLKTPQVSKDGIVKELPNCVNLGWNGTYTIDFTTPFYIWLLESL